MEQKQILVVEDEPIIAKDIQMTMESLGYTVPAVASSGREALRKAGETHPDLVLMDIVLKGDLDGVETAERIRAQYRIPVIYLTAYGDDQTLQRAKVTGPLGYLLKPFTRATLRTTIEVALYRHQTEKTVRESQQWLATALRSIGDAVMTTNREGRVTFMNSAAEALTGRTLREAMGSELADLLVDAEQGPMARTENPVTRALRDGPVRVGPVTVLNKDGTGRSIEGSATPMTDDQGTVLGVVVIVRDITAHRLADEERETLLRELVNALANVKTLTGLLPICASCKKIRNSDGTWEHIEAYISKRSEAMFTHGLCPECQRKFPV